MKSQHRVTIDFWRYTNPHYVRMYKKEKDEIKSGSLGFHITTKHTKQFLDK